MNVSGLFIRRPVMTTLVMAAILVAGIMAYRLLPVSDLPNVDMPTISVSADLPGASPETMASAVATPLERQFSTIAGLDSMTSSSSQGETHITLQFTLDKNIDAAAQDVQAAIAQAAHRLPDDMPSPPSYRKVNPADSPILYVALTSPTLALSALDEYGETLMAQRISTVSGVAQVLVYGSQKYAVRIQIDPSKLASRGIGLQQVASAIQQSNVNLPTGILYGNHKAFTVQANGQLTAAEGYRKIIVAYRNGTPVRLNQLGHVLDSVEQNKSAAWFVNQRAVVLAIQRQPGTNTVAVAEAVRKLLPTFRGQLPASVSLHVLFDRSESIHESVNDVKFTLFLALVLVILVIFLFLRNLSATVIPALALPMSLVGTFAAMYVLGYSLDNLSLMALTLSVGFVVDDAIVVLENIVRHMEMGKRPFEAALVGAREIGFTVISMTLSLAAVFLPVLFLGGIVGRLFHEFAVTIGAAVLISGVVSLTLTPMLSSRFLRAGHERRHGLVYQAVERGFDGMLHVYEVGLRWVLRHRRFTLFVLFAVFGATVYLFVVIPKGFLPSEDNGQIFISTQAQEGISYKAMIRHQQQVAAIVAKSPWVQAFMSAGGEGNEGRLFVHLKPRDQRPPVDEVIRELYPKVNAVPGMRVYMLNPPPIRIGGHMTRSQYQFTLQGSDTKLLYDASERLEAKMKEIPGLLDVTSDLEIKNPEVDVDIDRDRAASLGVSVADIETTLADAYGSRLVSTIFAPTNTYSVIMEVLPEYQLDPSALSTLYVQSSKGEMVPLSAVARLRRGLGPLSLNHSGQLPAVTLSFNLAKGTSLSEAVSRVGTLAQRELPASITTSFQGTAQAFQSSLSNLGVLLILTILVIYIVLGILYESFIHPLTILSALPLAGFGALVTLLLFHTELSIYAFVGVIMLMGLVKKNGIIMIDFALDAMRSEGKNATDAIYEACVVRFRPIMMTTFAALFGTLPIALAIGAGAESRQPLGLAVVGGLLFSQLLTLFVTPVVFTYMDAAPARVRRWLPFLRTPKSVVEAEGEAGLQA